MSNYPRGVIDIDDVKLDLVPSFCAWFNRVYGEIALDKLGHPLGPEDFWEYSVKHALNLGDGLDSRYLAEFTHSQEYRNMPPVSGAKEAVSHLSGRFQLHSVTLRRNLPHIVDITRYQISEHFGDAFGRRVHVVGNPAGPLGSKARTCYELQPQFVVDDHVQHARDMEERNIPLVVLRDAPWNRGIEDTKRIKRAMNWEQAVRLIDGKIAQA